MDMYMLQQRTAQQAQFGPPPGTLQAGSGRPVTALDAAKANDVFDHFLNAGTLKSILGHYRLLCDLLHLRPSTLPNFYPKLKQHLTSWRAKAVWKKFDGRANNKVYGKGRLCPDTRVLIIGAGPCGLRSAIEAQMLGAKVVVVEKRDRMSRNNVLHLWPFVIDDLRSLGAKKFFGKFCAGSIDHISIRQLQCILLKVALLLGIEIHTEVSFESLVEPSAENKRGWRASVKPVDHPVAQYEFDVIIAADGKRNTLQGFKRKEFRGKLAIAITANFINKRTEAEARVEEISGVAFIFNQKFFKDLYAETQIDLENIVYYKDDTHYFVMTAKKASLISKGVIRADLGVDTALLLAPENVDRARLMSYAREAAEFSTSHQMPDLEFAVNHYGQPDVAMFDFTSMYAAENASRVVEREGYRLLCILVGDSLLEPFWPTGSGCARGFLSSLDAAWAIRAWGSGACPLTVLAERESIYRLLGGTTPENLHRDSKSYTLEPSSRYPKLNRQVLTSHQVVGLYDTDDVEGLKARTQIEEVELAGAGCIREAANKRRKVDEVELLCWIKKQVIDYNVQINDLSESTFKDGKILCAILHHYRPDLVDYKDLPEDDLLCNHIAIELLEKEIGISSTVTPSELANMECTRSQLITYLSLIYETFKREIAHINHPRINIIPEIPVPTPKRFRNVKLNPSPAILKMGIQLNGKCERRLKVKSVNTLGRKNDIDIILENKSEQLVEESTKILEEPKLNLQEVEVIPSERLNCSVPADNVIEVPMSNDKFKDKLLFGYPNIIIKSEDQDQTSYLKLWSVSDYLLIVPKTFACVVNYISNTGNNKQITKFTTTQPDCICTFSTEEIELKDGCACCNIKKRFDELETVDKISIGADNTLDNVVKSCSRSHIDQIKSQLIENGLTLDRGDFVGERNLILNKCDNAEFTKRDIATYELTTDELVTQEERCDGNIALRNNIKVENIECTCQPLTNNDNLVCFHMALKHLKHMCRFQNVENINKSNGIDSLKCTCNYKDTINDKYPNGTCTCDIPNNFAINDNNLACLKRACPCDANLDKFCTEENCQCCGELRSNPQSINFNHFDNPIVECETIAHLSISTHKRNLVSPLQSTTHVAQTSARHRRSWQLSKVLKYGAGRHTTMHKQPQLRCTTSKHRTTTGRQHGAPSSVSDRIRTWLYTSDFERASVITTVARRGEEDRQQGQQQQDNLADNCTDITGLTSVTKSPPLFCMPTGSTRTGVGRGGEGRIVVESQRTILRFGPDGEPVKGIHKRVHEHRSPTSSKHSSPPKHHQSPSRLPSTHSPQSNFSSTHSSSPASPPEPHSSQPSYVSRAPTPVVVSSNTSPPPIQVKKAVEEEEEDDSNHSMEELAARLLNRFRGEVVGEGSSVGMGGGGGGGGKPRVIQTVSNPFSAITEREDDEILPEMPELKQRTAAPTTGGINAISDPMHHRNFAGLRATPLGAALAAPATVAPTSRPHHHHVRQAVPLGAARPVAAAPAAAAESDRVRGRKRKSAAGGGVGPSSTMGLAVARFECRQEIAENRADRQTRRRHHRRMQTEQFLKSMQMLQGNCKPDHSEPFEDYSLFVYRQTAPNFGDRVRDLEKTFIYVPVNGNNDRDPSRVLPTQQKGERDEDFAARIRELEDKWYEPAVGSDKKPKDLMRAIGKIETSDWNIREIEKKIRENRSGKVSRDRERVPKWSREQFVARQTKMEKKHQLDRQDSTNAKYTELDKNLKLLDQRLKEGTVRDLNQHKIAKITEKLKPKDQKGDANIPKSNSKQSVVVPTATNSEQCIFCSKRVYLMEKLSAENCCFHRNCFRCAYCHTILRAGAYKYDADGKYGHRFYCNHHYGFSGQLPTLQSRRGPGAPPVGVGVTNTTPPSAKPAKDQMMDQKSSSSPLADGASGEVSPSTPLVAPREGGLLGRVSGVDLLDRVQTPERIEFSNLTTGNASSDHEESLSIMDEDEWTDRNFGASTAEIGSSDDEDSYSDSDSEEEYEEAIEEPPTKEGNMRILERYSRFSKKHDSDSEEYSSSEQSSYCENTSGDEESDTATEGEDEILARELRKQEVRLEPPIITDNGTDTEINSDDTAYSKSNEAPNSATEISTDSEFAQDEPTPTREIPSIVFNDAFVTKTRGTGNVTKVQVTTTELRKHNVPNAASNGQARQPPKKDHFVPIVPNNIPTLIAAKKPTNLPLLNRLTDGFPLNRTQSTSGIAAMRSLELKKRYLLGETAPSTANSIQKSGSASTLDSKLKSFHSNISDCQKMLNPTAEVSSSMQVFCDKLKSPVEGAIPAVTSVTTVDTSVKTAVTSVKTAVTSVKTAVTTVSESIQNDAKSKPTSITDVPKASAVQSKPKENGNVAPEQFHNELEGRPRSPVHETSIIVPKIDWASQSKPPEYTDSVSSDSADEELEVQVEIQKKISEIPQKASESIQKMEDTQPKIDKHWQKTVEIEQKPMAAKAHKAFELELLDSLNYTPSLNEPPKSISSEKKTLNQPKTLPGLQQLYKTDYSAILHSGRSTPTHGNDSCITGCLTETELSDWARDGAVSDDFDYEYEHVSSRRNKEPKKLAQMATKDEDLKSLGNELEKSLHVCGKTDIIECVNSVLNPNLENIEFMDTGSESSCSDEGGLKNNGYVQFYNDNDIAEDSLSPVINNIQKMVVIDTRNPLMTATVEDFDELSTPTKNTGFCEVMVTPTSGNNFGGAVIDLKPIDLEHLKQKQSIAENEMDSLQVIDTGTEDNTCSDSTVKNVEVMKPYLDNNNTLDKRRLEDKLMQVKQDMMKRQDTNNETNKEDTELYVEHCQRLQSKVEFNNVRDSIDVRKGNRTPKPTTPPKPDLIREESALFTLTPTTKLYQKEVIAKERDINQRLIHEMILNKYKTENKTLERKKRSRNTFSPITPKPFELSKSATTDLTPCVNSVTPDVLLTTPHSTYINPIQKSQTMAEISNQVEQRYYDTPSPKQMAPPQQIYSIYQVQEKSLYDTGEKIRQDARTKAKLMSDTDLGLSPEDKILRLRERIRGFESTTPQKGVTRTNSNIVRDTKSGLLSNSAQHRNSVAETQFNRINIFGTSPSNIYSNDTLSKKRNKSFRRSQSGEPELTTSKSVNMLYGNEFVPEQSTSGGARKRTEVKKTFKSDSNLLLDKCEDKGAKKKSKDRERRKSITKVISDFFVSIKKDGNSNLNAAKGFLAKISPRAKERSKSCINLPRENLVKEPVLRKSASSDVHFARDASPPPVPPLPDNYTGNKLEDSSDAELEFRHCSLDNIDPALPDDTLGNTGSRRNSRGTVKRSTRQAQLKRHRTAQEIQRKLEETEVKVRDLELHGVGIEKRLRGERSSDDDDSADYASGSKRSSRDSDTDLLRQWFGVMRDLTEWRRYERELVTRAEELELEDRHARLQNQLRDKLGCDTEGGSSTEAGTILEEMMEIVAKRDSIIANLEQDKQRYTDEDKEFEEQMIAKGLQITPRRTSIEN